MNNLADAGTILTLTLVWGISAIAGILLIVQAFREKSRLARLARDSSKLGRAMNEARFRLRLAGGIVLLFWVIFGLIWVWIKGV